ncbi:SDR family NAD(P)-dependent oxidoreductase [Candidatus Micrarchaeota archaeon]|nr:SDR family NAD(P)-dependent oxidoreductase [Candidatus Micrarchaeota archaeon]
MNSILITGGAGFIGSHICDRLLKEGNAVNVIDNFDRFYDLQIKKSNVANNLKNPKFKLTEGDIMNIKDIESVTKDVDAIIHEAAQPGVRISVELPVKTTDVNIIGTLNVLETARKKDISKIVFASSSSVYGKIQYLPFDEEHPTQPISPYGASKLACEHYCKVFSQVYGLKIVTLRYFTVYGPRMRPDLAINKFMHKAIKGEDLEIYGDGKKTRDITYIEDATEANILALKYNGTDTFNIGGGNKISIEELSEKILKITKSKSKIITKENVKGDVEHTGADNKKAGARLGWNPKVKIDDGLKRYYEWIVRSINCK